MENQTKVKICGVNSPAAFDATVEAGADFLGFVFYRPSPRFITPAQAAALAAGYRGGPKLVGLFVNPVLADIEEVLTVQPLDILQIYAKPDEIEAFKTRFGLPVWRAVGVASAADFPAHNDPADGYVVEAKPPPGATRPGGNAVTADWDLLAGWPVTKFWLVAGGLTPVNVRKAIAQTGAPGVDVSSGVETGLGVKSPALIKKFIAAVKQDS